MRGVALVLLLLVRPLAAQTTARGLPGPWVGAPAEEYVRLLQLTGVMPLSSLMIRPAVSPMRWSAPDTAAWQAPWSARYSDSATRADTGRLTARMFHPLTHVTYNSAFAYGQNDGAMWAGRGLSFSQTAGGRVTFGPLTLDLAPTVAYSENKSFALAPHRILEVNSTPLADQYAGLAFDRPQRFGEQSYRILDPGQSGITVQRWGAQLGYTTANAWWGPGTHNSLIMTNNAAGVPRTFVGTRAPVSIGIGKLEALWTVGTMRESGYWRTPPDTFPGRRWLNGLTLAFEPKIAPGLYLAFTRLFYTYQKWNPITPREIFTQMVLSFEKNALADSASGNIFGDDDRDQMASVSFRWVVPRVGFEVYGEWGRNDHATDYRDFAIQPNHVRAYMLGAAKAIRFRDGVVLWRVEGTDLTSTYTYLSRAGNPWYTHHLVQQGYTQRGQIIGAGMGPGSNQQTLTVDWFRPKGRMGVQLQRQLHNIDGFYRSSHRDPYEQDASLFAGPRATWFAGPVELTAMYSLQYEYNRNAILLNDVRNHRVELRAQYWP
jgi:hypothetical protein